jgi:hypothetical protein
MKITGAPIGGPQRVNGGASGASKPAGFSASERTGGASRSAASARVGAPAGVTSLDALLALQEMDGPLERRRRSVRRAGRILDELDGVKLALLGDAERAPDALARLSRAVADQRSETDDDGLEQVLNEIEVRAAVELAKREPRRGALSTAS